MSIIRKIIYDDELPTLSVAMIVKNEEGTLGNLLSEVREVVDEIIVVDTGSTDKTKEVAESFGAKTYDYPWHDDFSAARNVSLKYCTKQYIIWLDADDFISKQEVVKLKHMIKDNPGKAIFISLVDKRPDKEYQSMQLRVFPNDKRAKFTGKVHEQVSFSLEEAGIPYDSFPVTMYHLGYTTEDKILGKLRRNLDILYKEAEEGDDFLVYVNITKTHIGAQEFAKANIYADKALDMVRKGTANVSKENMYIALMAKVNLLAAFGDSKGVKDLYEEFKTLFIDLPVFRLSYGESLFKDKEFAEAYKMLFVAKEEKINLGLIPLDYQAVNRSTSLLFLFSCLNVGDKHIAEEMIRRITGINDFTVPRILR